MQCKVVDALGEVWHVAAGSATSAKLTVDLLRQVECSSLCRRPWGIDGTSGGTERSTEALTQVSDIQTVAACSRAQLRCLLPTVQPAAMQNPDSRCQAVYEHCLAGATC